jgi:hypothetical protein
LNLGAQPPDYPIALPAPYACNSYDKAQKEAQMKTSTAKIETQFPSVYITLISVVLGFAIEDLITSLRALHSINVYSALTGVGIIAAIFTGWTGYSFVAMTQERMPNVSDGLNVFLIGLSFYLLNTTIGHEVWHFFAALSIYECFVLFASLYNLRQFIHSISGSYSWRDFHWNLFLTVSLILMCPVAAYMSANEMLAPGIEISVLAYFILANILWTYFFYKFWCRVFGIVARF